MLAIIANPTQIKTKMTTFIKKRTVSLELLFCAVAIKKRGKVRGDKDMINNRKSQ